MDILTYILAQGAGSSNIDVSALSKEVTDLKSRFNLFMNSDDTTLDQLSEIITYMKQNKTLIDGISVPTKLSQLSADSTHRLVTDTQISTWNSKSTFSGNYNDLTNKPTIPSISGLASETYVNNAVKNLVSTTSLNSTLSGYAKTSDIPSSYDDSDLQAKVADLLARVATLEGASA